MSLQRVLAATLAWLVVVASVSALVWVVISRAGDDLISADQPLTTTGGPGATTAAGATDRPSGTPSQSPSQSPSQTPSGGGSGGVSDSASPSAGSTPAVPPPTPSASPSSPASPTEPSSGSTTEQRRTWQGQAGSVVAACGASGIRLVSAQPANGFRAEVKDEDGALEVEFEGREDRAGTDVKVDVRCVDGIPTFSAESDD